MAVNWEAKALSTTKKIRAKGRVVVFRHLVHGVFDPATRTTTDAAPAESNVHLLTFDYDQRYVDGTSIFMDDVHGMMTAHDTSTVRLNAVVQDDEIVADGLTYTIANCKPFAPAGVVLFYDLQLRVNK